MSFTDEAKSIFTSKTFYGGVLSLTSVLFPHFYQHALAAIGVNDPDAISTYVVGLIGGALAIYGRFVAVQPVSLFGASKK